MRKAIKVFSALSDETRLRLIKLLESGGEVSVCDIMKAMNISQTRASRNLNILKAAELVSDRRDKHRVYYSLNRATTEQCCGDVLRVIGKWLHEDPEIEKDSKNLKLIIKKENKKL
jgi:ArsR family transcriptional regulator, arsenate/arsenite/antimonite-responsive transcriptional repressor